MRRMSVIFSVCALAIFSQAVNFPTPDGLFHDGAHVFSVEEKQQLQALVADLYKTTGAQLAIVTIPTLEGLSVEDYAVRLFKEWGIGSKEKNDGVLLLAAIKDRQMRIEVGYGLEPTLPDGLCGDIIRKELIPSFKAGRYGEGYLAATQRIARVIKGEESSQGPGADDDRDLASGDSPWFLLPFLSLFVLVGSFFLGAGLATRTFGILLFGLMFVGLPNLMGPLFLLGAGAPKVFLLWLPGLALFMSSFFFRKAKNSPSLVKSFRGDSTEPQEKWIMGGKKGGSGSGGFSSGGGGGFSGGGGSSGGGGASGRW